MKTGEQIAHVPLRRAGNTMHWCGKDHVLIDNMMLVDIRRQLPVWTHSIRRGLNCMLAPDDQHWYVSVPDRGGRGELKLRSVDLPDKEAIKATEPSGRNSFFAFRPG